jgi:ribosomal protein S18 acetylase RimI-like enzyme
LSALDHPPASQISDFQFHSLEKTDLPRLVDFLHKNIQIHRHLDWRPPAEWLGEHPFIAAEKDGKFQAVIALPDDPPGIFWVRLFAVRENMDDNFAWKMLFEKGLEEIQAKQRQPVAALAYSDWFERLLKSNQWKEHQRVVLLKFKGRAGEPLEPSSDYLLRPMVSSDVERVTQIDQACFEPLWQQSEDAIRRGYQQTAYASVMEYRDKVIAFQFTTTSAYNAHLARLAVLPDQQSKGVGTALVMDMLYRFKQPLIHEITVNTQQDNPNSIRLYQKLGFVLTGESFPILVYPDQTESSSILK